jgi:hypothetical protein
MTEKNQEGNYWLDLARQSYDMSTTYFDNNFRKKMENAIRHSQGKHHLGSKYNKAAYKYRSKLFRPKTRSAIRSNEAAAMQAFFANQDVVCIEPVDQNNPAQQASAEVNKELLEYRLTETIPWFQICLAGFQDAMTVGVVCSYQYWKYEERIVKFKIVDPEGNERVVAERQVVKDEPCVKLLPVENIRLHPAAEWYDPIGTSPFVIRLVPMYVADVLAKMKKIDPKTNKPKWNKLSMDQIKSAHKEHYDSTRSVREENREEKYDQASAKPLSVFDVVWVHEYFIRRNGEEYCYYTLGTEFMLTQPEKLKGVYFHGERPIVMGCVMIEPHKIMPNSPAMVAEDVQKEINENVNQRMDNVKFVLNKRWFAKRGSQIDLTSMIRNVPGSVTLMTNPGEDVVAQEFNDVTASAYREQDLLNLDYDELVGNFSHSTMQSNRRMNETVGGMQMIKGGTNNVQELTIRTFAETWAERVLKQLVKLEQKYESDMTVLAIAAQKAKLWQRYGVSEVTDQLLNQNLTIKVNIGQAATDPILKVNQLTTAMMAVKNIMADAPPGLKIGEIIKEVFGRLGYRDGSRFFENLDEAQQPQIMAMVQQMQQTIQQLQMELEDNRAELQTKLTLQRMKDQEEFRRLIFESNHERNLKIMDIQADRDKPQKAGNA